MLSVCLAVSTAAANAASAAAVGVCSAAVAACSAAAAANAACVLLLQICHCSQTVQAST